ncbi:MAG: ComF family protein [Caldiserica bacterium]|nr:ComF family protein [Caldisericota bacterium]
MWPSSSLAELLAAAGRGTVALLYPPRCFLCDAPIPEPNPLCGPCLEGLERFRGGLCSVCGIPVPPGIDLCRDCAVEPRPFTYARAIGPHRGTLRALILGLKYEGEYALARVLADLLTDMFPAGTELIAFVPPDPARRKRRHAAELLARELSRRVGVPVGPVLVKTRSTPPQVSLAREERRENVRGAFAARTRGRGERVVLVDDVYTTGSTVSDCATALVGAGFGEVIVLTAARTTPDDED